ncbi:MAG: RnfABCDGE type electron transport complex subunit G [Bacteroidales bacterium]|jgi:electron transport complex protein RnfG|nr:RnfABCDGE type electron transport complex subunit G [Bacteroidales bacterium]
MAKKESTIANMVLTLFIITGVAGVALSFVYNATKGPIAEAKQAKLEEAISIVLPEFDGLKEAYTVKPETGNDELTFYDAYKADEYVGTAIRTFTDKGFSGRIWIMIGFAPDGAIVNTAVLEHKETPGLGDKMDVAISDFPNQFEGKDPKSWKLSVTKDGGDVQAITAATISSRAFCDATRRAYDSFMNKNNGGTK